MEQSHSGERGRRPIFLKQARSGFKNGVNRSAFVILKTEVFEKFVKTHAIREIQLHDELFKSRRTNLFEEFLNLRDVNESRGQKRFLKLFGIDLSRREIGFVIEDFGDFFTYLGRERKRVGTEKPFSLLLQHSVNPVHFPNGNGVR